jgi:hypothetical protein
MKRVAVSLGLGVVGLLVVLVALSSQTAHSSGPDPEGAAAAGDPEVPAWWLERTKAAGKCLTCHKEKSPALYGQWRASEHGKHGVTCLDCHVADESEPDAFNHEGTVIATLVTPKDCGRCHAQQSREVDASYHATAGLILESADAYLAHAAGGHPRGRRLRELPRGQDRDRREQPEQARHDELAQHGHRAPQPGRQQGLLHGLPRAAHVLADPGAASRGLRQVPPRAGPSAEGGLRGEQARQRSTGPSTR